MDNPTKENLTKLLSLIERISQIEENKWFKDELHRKLSINFSFPEYFKAQKLQYKVKAKNFYKSIDNLKLKNELVDDYIEMSWYQSVNNIDRFLLFAYYQMENLINYYCKISNVYEKLKLNKDYYTHSYSEKFQIVTYNSFYYKERQSPLSKVSIWAKLTYWMYDSKSFDWERKNHLNISNLINIRNKNSHRNSDKVNKDIETLIEILKKSDISILSFYIGILKFILKSYDRIDPEPKKINYNLNRKKKLKGLTIKGKIEV